MGLSKQEILDLAKKSSDPNILDALAQFNNKQLHENLIRNPNITSKQLYYIDKNVILSYLMLGSTTNFHKIVSSFQLATEVLTFLINNDKDIFTQEELEYQLKDNENTGVLLPLLVFKNINISNQLLYNLAENYYKNIITYVEYYRSNNYMNRLNVEDQSIIYRYVYDQLGEEFFDYIFEFASKPNIKYILRYCNPIISKDQYNSVMNTKDKNMIELLNPYYLSYSFKSLPEFTYINEFLKLNDKFRLRELLRIIQSEPITRSEYDKILTKEFFEKVNDKYHNVYNYFIDLSNPNVLVRCPKDIIISKIKTEFSQTKYADEILLRCIDGYYQTDFTEDELIDLIPHLKQIPPIINYKQLSQNLVNILLDNFENLDKSYQCDILENPKLLKYCDFTTYLKLIKNNNIKFDYKMGKILYSNEIPKSDKTIKEILDWSLDNFNIIYSDYEFSKFLYNLDDTIITEDDKKLLVDNLEYIGYGDLYRYLKTIIKLNAVRYLNVNNLYKANNLPSNDWSLQSFTELLSMEECPIDILVYYANNSSGKNSMIVKKIIKSNPTYIQYLKENNNKGE